jgi:hypothetical protein
MTFMLILLILTPTTATVQTIDFASKTNCEIALEKLVVEQGSLLITGHCVAR